MASQNQQVNSNDAINKTCCVGSQVRRPAAAEQHCAAAPIRCIVSAAVAPSRGRGAAGSCGNTSSFQYIYTEIQ